MTIAMVLAVPRRLPEVGNDVATNLAIYLGGAVLMVVLWYVVRHVNLKDWGDERARLTRESAAFRQRWPNDRLWSAPLAELSAEAQRSRRLLDILYRTKKQYPADRGFGDFNTARDIRAWLSAVDSAWVGAATRDRGAVMPDRQSYWYR